MSVSVFGVVVVVELALDVFSGVFVEEGENLVACLGADFGTALVAAFSTALVAAFSTALVAAFGTALVVAFGMALVVAFGMAFGAAFGADSFFVVGDVSLDEVFEPLGGDHDVPPDLDCGHGDDGRDD